MAKALAVKWRPQTLDEIIGQDATVKILKKQIENNNIHNCMLFCGASGAGKTTAARAYAYAVNKGQGEPIEIDAASNNGVDNVREIIAQADERSLSSEYKVFIIDECHLMTNAAWNAFLKCIEEPPKYTIFIFCTTDPQKIPATILNRVMRFNFNRIGAEDIRKRLAKIAFEEGYVNFDDTIDYISRTSNGGMRDAIATLEKCAYYSTDLSFSNMTEALGVFSYEDLFDLVNNMIDGKESDVLATLNRIYLSGQDLKYFIDQLLDFSLNMTKYCLFNDIHTTNLPLCYEQSIKLATNFDNAVSYYNYLTDKLLLLKNNIKNDTSIRTTVEISLLQITRCQQ